VSVMINERYYCDSNHDVKVIRTFQKRYTIYRILFTDGTFYIGATSDFKSRKSQHIHSWGIPIKSFKVLFLNEIGSKKERGMISRYIKKFGVSRCRNKDLAPSTLLSTPYDVESYPRREYSTTQKVINATKEYFRQKENGLKVKQSDTAIAWGISLRLLASGIYIYKAKNSLIEPLFNGLSVELTSPNGRKIKTSTISKIQKILKDIENSMLENETTFDPANNINTQEGRDWFFSRTKLIGSANGEIMKDLAELANYKFNDKVRLNQDTGEVN